MSTCKAIEALTLRGWSRRRVARKLDCSRETLGGRLGQAKPAVPLLGSVAGQRSQCEELRAVIVVAVEQGLSAQRPPPVLRRLRDVPLLEHLPDPLLLRVSLPFLWLVPFLIAQIPTPLAQFGQAKSVQLGYLNETNQLEERLLARTAVVAPYPRFYPAGRPKKET